MAALSLRFLFASRLLCFLASGLPSVSATEFDTELLRPVVREFDLPHVVAITMAPTSELVQMWQSTRVDGKLAECCKAERYASLEATTLQKTLETLQPYRQHGNLSLLNKTSIDP